MSEKKELPVATAVLKIFTVILIGAGILGVAVSIGVSYGKNQVLEYRYSVLTQELKERPAKTISFP